MPNQDEISTESHRCQGLLLHNWAFCKEFPCAHVSQTLAHSFSEA